MKKQFAKKIISRAITFTFALFFLQIILATQVIAANELNWENPNKNGNNPYRFKATDVLSSPLIMQVVGCTGAVDRVSGAIMSFVRGDKANEKLKKAAKERIVAAAVESCKASKKGGKATVIPIINMNWAEFVNEVDCKPIQKTQDGKTIDELIELRQDQQATKIRDECFSGIAITLAKNQLTSMTRYTMNWINTGFNGDPMYVQNITSLTNNIERNILEKSYQQLGNSNMAYPYGSNFSRSLIRSYKAGVARYGGGNFLDSLTSDLTYFINDKVYDYGNKIDKRTALQRAKDANDAFANDFSTGGWDGWLALTQRDQNNPLGFTMQASQYLADRTAEQKEEVKNELAQNNGFRSQKKCVLWELRDVNNDPIYEEEFTNFNLGLGTDGSDLEDNLLKITKTSVSKPDPDEYPNSICIKDEVVTPGSIIKDKLAVYVNSPERQLELADTINESLNSLFSALVSKLQNQGLSSLSSEKYDYTINGFANDNMGVSYGYTDNFDGGSFSSGSGYRNGSFDLTRDLGNTYIYNYNSKSLGNWDAKTNSPKLYVGVGPVDKDVGKNGKYLTNGYYTVTVAGNTKLFNEGYNGWAVGDRAFWDGKSWQNWKKDIAKDGRTIKSNPIAKRGVIQIQNDYIVAAKELLSFLPNIMPKLGELDYCIPGPNPNWQSNSSEARSLFQDYTTTLSSDFRINGWLERDATYFKIGQSDSPEYINYKNVFNWNNKNIWATVLSTPSYFGELFRLAENHGNGPDHGYNDNEAQGHQNEILDLINKIGNDFNNYYDLAGEMFDKLYGKDGFLQKEFFEKENSSELIKNPSYLPMAEEGLAITKNILAYDQDIKDITEEYKDAISEANSNISKLNLIRSEVSKIIKIAQDRRDANLIKILNEETIRVCNDRYADCMSTGYGLTPQEAARVGERGQLCTAKKQICESNVMTEAQYKRKYASCLAEEDIRYYDDSDIINGGGGERCNDGIDNDLDGLIDQQDPDCESIGGGTGGDITPPVSIYCSLDTTDPPRQTNQPNSQYTCAQRLNQKSCEETPFILNKVQRPCFWDGPAQ